MATDDLPTMGGPIPLNAEQLKAITLWAADDRLWTTQETVEFNLQTFARVILEAQGLGSAVPLMHRCSGCGYRWEGPLKGAELCGDCWRKGQDAIFDGGPPGPAP
jgi:hypothetical protein